MYSSMMTPVCTETPKSAKKPTPEETLKCVPVNRSASNPPMGAIATFARIRIAHLSERHSNLHVTNKYLQATSKTKRLAHDKLVDAFLPAGLLPKSKPGPIGDAKQRIRNLEFASCAYRPLISPDPFGSGLVSD